jgi:hypothetical protein
MVNAAPDKSQASPRRRYWPISIVIFLLTFLLAYAVLGVVRSANYYRALKLSGHGWSKSIRASDPNLGFVPIPNSSATEYFRHGFRMEVRQDENGFRVPVDETKRLTGAGPKVLALGCSFTFGSGVMAEETFPYLVAKQLDGQCMNGGVEGYGLAQMVQQARTFSTNQEPGVVLIEYAPWLLDRAVQPVAPTAAPWSIASPYIAGDGETFTYCAPTFQTNYFSLPLGDYVTTKSSKTEFASFCLRAGFPLWIRSDWNHIGNALANVLGRIPAPAQKSPELATWAYEEIVRPFRSQGTKIFIVVLGDGGTSPEVHSKPEIDAIMLVEGIALVDAYSALYNALPEHTSHAYEDAYSIRSGEPPVLVDRHPNALAHARIAEAIMAVAP